MTRSGADYLFIYFLLLELLNLGKELDFFFLTEFEAEFFWWVFLGENLGPQDVTQQSLTDEFSLFPLFFFSNPVWSDLLKPHRWDQTTPTF